MDLIPPEIRENIIGHILGPYYGEKLAQYASISRAWQASVERHTFRRIKISTDDLNAFAKLFDGENTVRRRLLTTLEIVFILPSPPAGPGCCPVERKPNRDADSASFSASVANLFHLLSNVSLSGRHPLSLTFATAYRMSKFEEPEFKRFLPCRGNYEQHTREEIDKAVADFGLFELIGEDNVPLLNEVLMLEFRPYEDLRYLNHNWIPKLVCKLPDLQQLVLGIEDSYSLGQNRRCTNRETFVKAVSSLPRDHLVNLQLNVDHESMLNESVSVQQLAPIAQWRAEAWSVLMSQLASFQSLTSLQLRGGITICPTFFLSFVDSTSSFSSLQELVVEFAPETADGRWFYERDDDAFRRSREDPEYEEFWQEKANEAEDDEYYDEFGIDPTDGFPVFGKGPVMTYVERIDRFRSLPHKKTLLPFLIEAAQVVKRITSLQKFILTLKDKGWPNRTALDYPFLSRVFELWFLKVGTPRSPRGNTILSFPKVYCDAQYQDRNRLYWRTEHWKPWEKACDIWQEVVGPDAKIVFIDEDRWTRENGIGREIYEGEF